MEGSSERHQCTAPGRHLTALGAHSLPGLTCLPLTQLWAPSAHGSPPGPCSTFTAPITTQRCSHTKPPGHWSLSHHETQFLEATDSHARGRGDCSPIPVIWGEWDLSAEEEINKGEQQRTRSHNSTARSQRSQVPPIPHHPHGHAVPGVQTETQC